jgi:uncharacterized protein YbcI
MRSELSSRKETAMATEEERLSRESAGRSGLSAHVSTRMVQLFRDYTGRGPTKARTYVQDDLIVCVMRDTLGKGELAIAEHLGHDIVLDQRRAFQRAMRADAVALVEELTGRSVVAFMSDNHIDPDIAVETFVLEPESAN